MDRLLLWGQEGTHDDIMLKGQEQTITDERGYEVNIFAIHVMNGDCEQFRPAPILDIGNEFINGPVEMFCYGWQHDRILSEPTERYGRRIFMHRICEGDDL